MTTYRNPRQELDGDVEFDRPADRIRTNMQAHLDRLAADKSLTDAARKSRRAKVVLDARRAMATAKENSDKEYADKVAKARRKALGVDDLGGKSLTDRIALQTALRDARSRAEKVDDPEVMAHQLQTALEVGDDVEAKGITAAALAKAASPVTGQPWVPVLDRYSEARPEVAPALQDLLDLESSTELSRNGFTFVVPTPSDLSHGFNRGPLSDSQLGQLAEGGGA